VIATLDRTQTISVKSISLHRVRIPLVEPFRISNGAVSEKESILVELLTDDGHIGWGESSPMSGSFYSGDTPDSVWENLSSILLPLVLNAGEIEVAEFYKTLRTTAVDPFAKAGIEGALWDALAQESRLSLNEMLGATVCPIPSGVAIGIFDSVDDLLARVERFVSDGYRRVKIKIEPGWDLEPVRRIRSSYPTLPLMVDANAAYSIDDIDVFRELDKFELMMIEQPLSRTAHEEAAELQRNLRTPICADESAESLEALSSIIEKKAARIINIKVQRVGGLSEAKLMLKVARAAGLECWVGTMPELGVASAQGLHFATLDGFSYPTDIEASRRWFVDDVIEPLIEIDSAGYINLPQGPGSGYQVSRDKLERYSVAECKFTS
jgi:O-succinylbenzoate synthase